MNYKNILVSVIIPNYKRCQELKRALTSVINQTFNNLEILVIDDCSPNFKEIESVVDGFKDCRITLIRQKENKGGGAARNVGILLSKGKYIAFLDSDDTWNIEKIKKQLVASEEHLEEVLCYNKSIVYTDNWTKVKPETGKLDNETISEYLFVYNNFMPTPSLFLSTSLAKKCLFDESLPRHQDYDFLFKIEKQKAKIIFVNEKLTNVIWTNVDKVINKGWSSDFSEAFFDSYRQYMGERSYANAIFHSVIYASLTNESKKKSLNYFFNKFSLLRYVKKTLLLKYLVRLVMG
jgi:glycosyltransferase involved in cell wall biosynthesis